MKALAPLILFATFACTNVHVVKRDARGGTLALEGDADNAYEEAEVAMAEHCNGSYKVLRRGEELVPRSAADFDMARSEGMKDEYRHEYRVVYACDAP